MLAERILSAIMRHSNQKTLMLSDYGEARLPEPTDGREYLLYVHVPFCARLCPYCSFNRFPFDEERATAYFRRLREELRTVADQGYRCTSMYVGGGTPTVIIEELCATIDLARGLLPIREVSCETNPDHLIPAVVDDLEGRVDRLSVGVQSFDDGLLAQMDRLDKYGSGAEILERLRAIESRFHSLNVDMIFNFPLQTEAMLVRDVEMLIASRANQVTFYPLMASPVVKESLRRSVGKVSYAREARLYDVLCREVASAFEPASAWTFSRTGGGMIDEYIVDYEEYVGIGAGAFSFLRGALYVNTFSLAEYMRRVDAGATPATTRRTFGQRDVMRYRFLMRLFGLSLDKTAFEKDFGLPIERGLPLEMAFMRVNGAFEVDNDELLTLTRRGRYLLVAMMREFFIGVNALRDQAREALPSDELDLFRGRAAGQG